jgi:hypothetical protein
MSAIPTCMRTRAAPLGTRTDISNGLLWGITALRRARATVPPMSRGQSLPARPIRLCKSTNLRIAAGLKGPTGLVVVGAVEGEASRAPERARRLMFQDYALFPHLSARERRLWPLEAAARRTREARRRRARPSRPLEAQGRLPPHALRWRTTAGCAGQDARAGS